MEFWMCENCGQPNSMNIDRCFKCGRENNKNTNICFTGDTQGKVKRNYRPTSAFTIVYIQNGKEIRNVIDGLTKESIKNKFLKCMNRIKESDIVDILEGEHLD